MLKLYVLYPGFHLGRGEPAFKGVWEVWNGPGIAEVETNCLYLEEF